MTDENKPPHPMSRRFRGFLPVVVDVETAGFNPERDALLEVAAVILTMDDDGWVRRAETHVQQIDPFEGANLSSPPLISPVLIRGIRSEKRYPSGKDSARSSAPFARR